MLKNVEFCNMALKMTSLKRSAAKFYTNEAQRKLKTSILLNSCIHAVGLEKTWRIHHQNKVDRGRMRDCAISCFAM